MISIMARGWPGGNPVFQLAWSGWMPKPNNKLWTSIGVSGRAMCDRHAPVSDQCAHRGAIGSCSGWIVGDSKVMDPLNQASAAPAHVGHTHDPFRISSLQFEWSTWFSHHSDVVDFVDGAASFDKHPVQCLCGCEC